MTVINLFVFVFHQVVIMPCFGINWGMLQYFRKDFSKIEEPNKHENNFQFNLGNKTFKSNEEVTRELYDSFVLNPDITNNTNNNTNDVEYITHIKRFRTNRGCLKLKLLADIIKHNIDPYVDIQDIIETAVNTYIKEMDKCFQSVRQKDVAPEVEKDLIFLNIVESTNEIFQNGCKALFDSVLTESINSLENVADEDLKLLTFELKNIVTEEKLEGLKHVCVKTKICRHLPAFSDHFADLLTDIFPLADEQFLVLLKTVKDIVEGKVGFFQSIMNDDIAFNISSKLKPLLTNVVDGEKLISVIKGAIRNRYKLENDTTQKTKAVRILIDMVDKSFEDVGPNLQKFLFDTVKMGIINWKAGKRQDLVIILGDFINSFFDILRYYWDEYTKDEVNVLIEVIIKGTSGNEIVQEELFTEGSEFVRGDEGNFYPLEV